MQFNLLTYLGLREHHHLLDIGCGSLRAGRLFIPYLLPGRYYGLEPEQWLLREGIRKETGEDLIRLKAPTFRHDHDFRLTAFGQTFDYILANSIFSHATQEQVTVCLQEAAKVLNPSGIFAATFLRGESNYNGSEWVYPECVTYTLDFMQSIAEEHELMAKPLQWPHPSNQTWLLITHPTGAEKHPELEGTFGLVALKQSLQYCRERLRNLEGHPYVRVGLWVYRMLRRRADFRQSYD